VAINVEIRFADTKYVYVLDNWYAAINLSPGLKGLRDMSKDTKNVRGTVTKSDSDSTGSDNPPLWSPWNFQSGITNPDWHKDFYDETYGDENPQRIK
jgi:hypothetical protein